MKRIALLGMPNTGKSTLFNRLSGASAKVGNWPGITVNLMSAKILLGGHIAELVDLPGIYDLHGFSDDEHVVRHFLSNHPIDLLMVVANSTQIDRQLSLVLQLRQLGLPAILLLNMRDEAKSLGIHIQTATMAEKLNIPVIEISAKYGDQCNEALKIAAQALQSSLPLSQAHVAQVLASDMSIEQEMESIIESSVDYPSRLNDEMTTRLDNILLHPWLGMPIFLFSIYLLFELIFTAGKPLQDGVTALFTWISQEQLTPLLSNAPDWLSGLLVDGLFTGLSTVAAFVPVIILFFLVMTVVEDSGYLSRAAFLMDALMAKIGLDGRGFVMVLMGFGCNVPALMGTRVMRSRNMRLLTMLVIPLSLCSARLQVFLFMSAILFAPHQAALVLFSLYMVSFATIFLTALIHRKRYQNQEPFILELPPYRLPTARQIILSAWQEIRHFLHRATSFIVLGVVMVWLLTHFPADAVPASAETWAGKIGLFFQPVLEPIGIDTQLAIALIFGFVAKEIVIGSLAVIYGLQGDALAQTIASHVDWVQGLSFMLFTLIYTPCLSTIATLKNEAKSWGFAAFSLIWSLGLAWIVAFVFYQSMRHLGY